MTTVYGNWQFKWMYWDWHSVFAYDKVIRKFSCEWKKTGKVVYRVKMLWSCFHLCSYFGFYVSLLLWSLLHLERVSLTQLWAVVYLTFIWVGYPDFCCELTKDHTFWIKYTAIIPVCIVTWEPCSWWYGNLWVVPIDLQVQCCLLNLSSILVRESLDATIYGNKCYSRYK